MALQRYNYFYECQNCFKPAFYLKRKPKRFQKTSSDNCVYANGVKPKRYEKIVCPCCKKDILIKDLLIDFVKEFGNGTTKKNS